MGGHPLASFLAQLPDRAAAAANRESAGERAEPMMLALINLAVQNHAHQATQPAAG
jgi:hypothetical protein